MSCPRLEQSLGFVLDEYQYNSKKLVQEGKDNTFRRGMGRGVFFSFYHTMADLYASGPGNSAKLIFLTRQQAMQAIDYEHCLRMIDEYDPTCQVVCVVGVHVRPTNHDGIFKGRIIGEETHRLVPDVFDSSGRVIQGDMLMVPADDSVDFSVARCRNCNARETQTKKLKKCSQCKAARYCNRECQRKDWSTHKSQCILAKEARKEGKKFVRAQREG